jgi:hypothetical protein
METVHTTDNNSVINETLNIRKYTLMFQGKHLFLTLFSNRNCSHQIPIILSSLKLSTSDIKVSGKTYKIQ